MNQTDMKTEEQRMDEATARLPKMMDNLGLGLLIVPVVSSIALTEKLKNEDPERYYSLRSRLKELAVHLREAAVEIDKLIVVQNTVAQAVGSGG